MEAIGKGVEAGKKSGVGKLFFKSQPPDIPLPEAAQELMVGGLPTLLPRKGLPTALGTGKPMKGAAVPISQPRTFRELAEGATAAKRAGLAEVGRFGKEMATTIRTIAKDLEVNPDDVGKIILHGAEVRQPWRGGQDVGEASLIPKGSSVRATIKKIIPNPELSGGVEAANAMSRDPRANRLIQQLKSLNAAQFAREEGVKIPIKNFSTESVDYFIHALTPEAKKVIASRQGWGSPRLWTDRHASLLKRSFGDLTITEANTKALAGELRILGGQKVKLFVDDPVIAQTIRSVRHVNAVTSAEFFEWSKLWGVAKKEAPLHYQPGPSRLKTLWFDPEIASYLKTYEAATQPQVLNSFLRTYDLIQNTWKRWTLMIFPAYHSRNAISNYWNNFLADVKNPQHYKDAWRLLDRTSTVPIAVKGKTLSPDTFMRTMQDRGVVNTGWYAADIPSQLHRDFAQGSWWTLGQESKALRLGMKVGERIENQARVAHVLGRLTKGDNMEEAVLSMKKYLFDYTELSDFERVVLKRAMPFFTWTRKNIPLQAEALLKQPAKFAGLEKGIASLETALVPEAPDERFLPQWMKDNYPMRVRKNSRGNTEYFLLGSWLPAADLMKLITPFKIDTPFAERFGTVTDLLSPLIKMPVEQIFNFSLFFNQPLERFPGETRPLGPIEVRGRVLHLLGGIRILNEVKRLLDQRNPVSTKVAALVTGKLHPFDEEESRRKYTLDIQRQIRETESAMRSRLRRGQFVDTLLARRQQLGARRP